MTDHGMRGLARFKSTPLAGRRLLWLLALAAVAVGAPSTAWAQYVTCPANIDLKTDKLTEIVSHNGVLSGMVVMADEQRAQTLAPKNNITNCLPQLRRLYQDHENLGPLDINAVHRPVPGPTLRASLGDVVQLTFLNQIDPLDYGNSIDRWQQATGDLAAPGVGCDSVTAADGYPNVGTDPVTKKPVIDTMPNCFHGSRIGRAHV